MTESNSPEMNLESLGSHLLHEDTAGKILSAAIEVHRMLGPGLLESAYQACLCHELSLRGVDFRTEVPLPVDYKGVHLDCGYRIDLVSRGQSRSGIEVRRQNFGDSSIPIVDVFALEQVAHWPAD